MRLLSFRNVIAVLALFLAFDTTALAAPPIPNDRAIDIDLKQAGIANLYRLLSDLAGREFALDPCTRGMTVDLTLKNTPVSLVLDALALKLHLTYEEDGNVVNVRCTGDNAGGNGAPTPRLSEIPRVTIAMNAVELPVILDAIAKASNLEGVDYKATAKPKVDLTVTNVRIGTVLAALSDESGLRVSMSKNRLVVTEAR